MNPSVSNGNKLRWKFENVKNLTDDGMCSDKMTIEPVDWKIRISTRIVNRIKFLEIRLIYDSDNNKESNWICEVEPNFKIMKQGGDKNNIEKEFSSCRCYHRSSKTWGFSDYLDWSSVMKEDEGYLKNDSMDIEIDFNFRYYDFSKKIPNVTDITINVEDTEFHLNKWALGSRSQYFHDLILKSKPNEMESIKLDDIKAENFCYMLASFYPFFDANIDQNYVELIELARKFEVSSLHHICEQFLMNESKLELIDKIKYADENDYEKLMMNPIVSNGNKLRWKFENVKNFTNKGMFSEKFTISSLDWKILTRTHTSNNNKYLAIELFYDSDNSENRNWICETDATFLLFGKNGNCIRKKIKNCYMKNAANRGFNNYLLWSDLISDTNGYLNEDSIIIGVDFNFRYYDFSKPIPNVTDIIVNVEDTEFHLNKWALGSRSKYFYDLILKTESNDMKCIKLNDIKAEHFCYMLASLDHFFAKIPEYKFVELIEMARKFEVSSLHHICEQYLINNTKLELIDKIKYADENDYEQLLQKCIQSLENGASIKELQVDPKFFKLKDTTKLRVMFRILDFH